MSIFVYGYWNWDVAFGGLWAFLQDTMYWTLLSDNRTGWITPNRREDLAGPEIPWKELTNGGDYSAQEQAFNNYIENELERYQASRDAFEKGAFHEADPEANNFPNSPTELGCEYTFKVSCPEIYLPKWKELVYLFERSLWKFVRGIKEWQGKREAEGEQEAQSPRSDVPIGITALIPDENSIEKFQFFVSANLDGETVNWLNEWLKCLELGVDQDFSNNGTENARKVSYDGKQGRRYVTIRAETGAT